MKCRGASPWASQAASQAARPRPPCRFASRGVDGTRGPCRRGAGGGELVTAPRDDGIRVDNITPGKFHCRVDLLYYDEGRDCGGTQWNTVAARRAAEGPAGTSFRNVILGGGKVTEGTERRQPRNLLPSFLAFVSRDGTCPTVVGLRTGARVYGSNVMKSIRWPRSVREVNTRVCIIRGFVAQLAKRDHFQSKSAFCSDDIQIAKCLSILYTNCIRTKKKQKKNAQPDAMMCETVRMI